MTRLRPLLLAGLLLCACDNDDPAAPRLPPPDLGTWDGTTAPQLSAASLPDDIAALDAAYYPEISCGPHAQNLADLVVPNGVTAPPLLVYIHGGGFTGGSRLASFSGGRAAQLMDYVEAGFAYATIDYRFLDSEGVRTSLQDSQVCIQFLRYHADALGFDGDHIVLAGGSAGAGTSLWIAAADDLAEPDDDHPILRVSTEVDGVILDETQATYDVLRWQPDVFDPRYPGIFDLVLSLPLGQVLLDFYGVPDVETLEEPYYVEYRAAIDMLSLLSPDDPPIWVRNAGDDRFPLNEGIVLHHPYHARTVRDAALAAGVEVVGDIQALDITTTETRMAFATRVTGN